MGCKGCEKPKVSYRKGLWSPEEDERLREYIIHHGHVCWSAVPINAGELHTYMSSLLISHLLSGNCCEIARNWTANHVKFFKNLAALVGIRLKVSSQLLLNYLPFVWNANCTCALNAIVQVYVYNRDSIIIHCSHFSIVGAIGASYQLDKHFFA